MKRYAMVRGHNVDADKVRPHLPGNYSVIHEQSNWPRWDGDTVGDTVVVIMGEDRLWWTLDHYIAPRLGSGLMSCTEVDLSHPIMMEVDL